MDKDRDDVISDNSSNEAGDSNIVYLSDFASSHHNTSSYYLDTDTEYSKSSINYYECMPTLSEATSYDKSISSTEDTFSYSKPSFFAKCLSTFLKVITLGAYKSKKMVLHTEVISTDVSANVSEALDAGYVFYDKDYNLRLLKGTKRICIISDLNCQVQFNKYFSNE